MVYNKKSQQGKFAGIYMKKRNFLIITMEVYKYDKRNRFHPTLPIKIIGFCNAMQLFVG